MKATISRWGNSLAVRIPRAALEEACLAEGDQVDVVTRDGQLVVVKSSRRSLTELISRITPENRHAETISALAGNEVW